MKEILLPDDTEERCGLVMDDGSLVEIQNIAPEPEKGFEMSPEAVVALLETGHVVGTWHTHPHGQSNHRGEDHSFFLSWPDLSHTIIGRNGVSKYRVENGVVLVCN